MNFNCHRIFRYLLYVISWQVCISCSYRREPDKCLESNPFSNLEIINGDCRIPFKDEPSNWFAYVQVVNFDCTICVEKILFWKEYFEKNNFDQKSSLFIVAHGDIERAKIISDMKIFDGNILHDKNNSFSELFALNSFPDNIYVFLTYNNGKLCGTIKHINIE